VAVEGTPLAEEPPIDPLELVRMVAVARILMPHSRVRLSAGREQLGREAQILCLLAAATVLALGRRLGGISRAQGLESALVTLVGTVGAFWYFQRLLA